MGWNRPTRLKGSRVAQAPVGRAFLLAVPIKEVAAILVGFPPGRGLDLDPVALAGPVGRIPALADDAFQPMRLCLLEKFGAADEAFRIPQLRAGAELQLAHGEGMLPALGASFLVQPRVDLRRS